MEVRVLDVDGAVPARCEVAGCRGVGDVVVLVVVARSDEDPVTGPGGVNRGLDGAVLAGDAVERPTSSARPPTVNPSEVMPTMGSFSRVAPTEPSKGAAQN